MIDAITEEVSAFDGQISSNIPDLPFAELVRRTTTCTALLTTDPGAVLAVATAPYHPVSQHTPEA